MATFLTLAQDVRQEAGLAGTGPAAVTNQVGMDKKLVTWVKNAWIDIQEAHSSWRFLWKDDGLLTTNSRVRGYSPSSLGFSVRTLSKESIRAYVGSVANEMWISHMDYPEFREKYLRGVVVSGRPITYTWTPDNRILFYPVPNDAYTVSFEYYRTPQVLAQNGDTPICPEWLHDAIKYRALMYYAAHDENNVLYQAASAEYARWRTRLEDDQLATPMVAGALA